MAKRTDGMDDLSSLFEKGMEINTSKINAIKVAAVIQGHGGVLAKTNTNTYGAEIPAPKLYEGQELKYIGLKYCGFALWSGLDMANQVVDVVKAYMGHHLHGTKIDIEALGSAINEAFTKPYLDFLQEVHDKRGAYADPANINTQHPILIPPPTDPDMFGINKKYNSSNAEKIFTGITEDEYRAGLRPAIFTVNGNIHTAGPIVTLCIIIDRKDTGNIPVECSLYFNRRHTLTEIVAAIYAAIPAIISGIIRENVIIDHSNVDLTIVDFTCATAYAAGTGPVLAGQFPRGQFTPGTGDTRYATMDQIQDSDEFARIMKDRPGGSHGGKKRGQTKRRRHKSRASRHQKRGYYKRMRSIRKHNTRAAR